MKIQKTMSMISQNITVFCLLVCLLLFPHETAGAQDNLEYRIKAAFLYNFAKFVEWPNPDDKGSSMPFVIGVLGDDPFGPELDAIEQKTINGRQISIKRFGTIDDVSVCHLLFFSFEEPEKVKKALRKISNQNILTVGEAVGFAQTGGMIGFVEKEKKYDLKSIVRQQQVQVLRSVPSF
ncbi:MAG: YfiR family protein [Pseudomonadota bacterium]